MKLGKLFFIALILTAGKGFSAEKNNLILGPILTFSDREINKVTLYFYTKTPTQVKLFVSNKTATATWPEKGKDKNHRFRIKMNGVNWFYYRVLSDEPGLKDLQGTVTVPRTPRFRFAFISDTHGEYGIHESLCRVIAAQKPAFLINGGDIVPESMDRQQWAKLFAAGKELYASTPFIPTVGNHDFYGSLWRKLFDVSNNRNPFYSYKLPGMVLVVLNSEMYLASDSMQYRWLEEELKKAGSDTWKVVVIHRPPFSSSHHRDELEIANIRNYFVPLFEKYNVNLVLSGHEHLYERSQKGKVCYITSGGANRNMYPTGASLFRKKLVTHRNHFVLIDVDEKNLNITALDTQGKKLDAVSLSK